ncbi:50S ribosomal protein L29 [Candidatus Peregrinibacteria bacterium]|nr:MAG: 50S ribosomal protein L29 [Candidatus Peregrinibacteria bacterium]
MKTTQQIRDLSDNEIRNEILRTEHHLVGLRMKIVTSQEKDTSKKGKFKKYIARLKTILNERSIGFSATL